MIRKLYSLICFSVFCLPFSSLYGNSLNVLSSAILAIQDTTGNEQDVEISEGLRRRINTLVERKQVADSVDVQVMNLNPFLSAAQYTKGYVSGLYVQEGSGEPGSLKISSGGGYHPLYCPIKT